MQAFGHRPLCAIRGTRNINRATNTAGRGEISTPRQPTERYTCPPFRHALIFLDAFYG